MTLKNRVDDHCDSSSAEQWEIAYAKLKQSIKNRVTSHKSASRDEFLKSQCDHFSDLNGLIKLLQCQHEDGWTLGHVIARYHDSATTKQYLDLLSSMQLTPGQLYQLLALQTKTNWTLGHVIARHQGPAATKQYLDLLSSKQLTPDQLYQLLTMRTNQDPATTKQYLDLYQFYQLLALHNKDKCTLGHMIEKYQPKEEKKLYIATTMGRLISHAVSDKNLPMLSPDERRYFSQYKEAILNHLLTLEEGEKLIALKNALDKTHPLGQIFWHQRGWVAPNLNSGSLKIIAAEVKKIRPQTNKLQCKQVENKVTMSTAAPQQKTTEQITEADIPYTGNYPNLYRLLNSSKAQSTQPAIHSKVVQIMRPDYTELTPNPYLKQIITDQYGVLYLSVSPSAVSKVNDKAQEKTYPLQTEKRQFTSALFKQPNSVEDTARNEEEKQRIVATLTLLENAPAAPTNELILSSSTEENPPQIRHEKKAVLL